MRPKTCFRDPLVALPSANARPDITSPDVVGCLANTRFKAPVPLVTGRPLDPNVADASPGPVYMIPPAAGVFRHPSLPRPPTILFGSGMRWRAEIGASPGSGSYDPGRSGYQAPQWSIRSRSVEIDRSGLVPDPGTYDVTKQRVDRLAKGFTLVGRREYSDVRDAGKRPGPGEYNVKHKFNSTVTSIPNWSFNMARRFYRLLSCKVHATHTISINSLAREETAPASVGPRLSWDEYFMALAALTARRSKDPATQVGACIVNSERRVVGVGYNGFPAMGAVSNDQLLPWSKDGDGPLDTKYLFVCHAELNAVMNKNQPLLKDCSIYTTLFPCNECAKIIIQSGITRVVYLSDAKKTLVSMRASRKMLLLAGVTLQQFISTTPTLDLFISSNSSNCSCH